MTRTKTTKLVAIVMAVFMAFAFMSFSLTYVSAENEDTATAGDTANPGSANNDNQSGSNTADNNSSQLKENDEQDTPTTPTAPTPKYSFTEYNYGAPDVNVRIEFGTLEPEIDYDTAAKNPTSQDISVMETLSKILSSIKVYRNYDANADEGKQYTNEVNIGAKFSNLKYDASNHSVTFTVPLNKASNLTANSRFYLWLGPALNETKDANNGSATHVPFDTKSTTASTRSTTRSTTRTIYTVRTTNRTIKAKSANTDDPRHLPVWIGLVAVSALMLGAVYFVKERD